MFKVLLITLLGHTSDVKADSLYPPISRYEQGQSQVLSTPVSLKAGVNVSYYHSLPFSSVRMVFDSVNNVIYSNTFGGDIYKTEVIGGVPQASTQFISSNEHTINRMQALLFYDNALYMSGNAADDVNKRGRGQVVKCVIGSGGSKTFSTILNTDFYASSTTLFDHAFSAIVLNPTKDSLFIASGSRTDHGEEKSIGGLYPGLREEPLTTKIYRIPLQSSTIYLQNNETWLQNSGYVYCEGVRNEFDMAFNAKGELFGVENMGDRDDPEELNLLQEGKHYGFPWKMGGNLNPQQFSGYDPSMDLLLPSNLFAPQIFYDDPTFPQQPSSLIIEDAIVNAGPDANWVRNPTTGVFEQKSNVTTFTSHRSPLGLTFDTDSTLDIPYLGGGFVLAYTSGGGASGYLNAVDEGADLCALNLIYDSNTQKYTAQVERLVRGFDRLVDALLVNNEMFILEETGNVFKVTFPVLTAPLADFSVVQDSNCGLSVNLTNTSSNNALSYEWNLGNGTQINSPLSQYTYSNNGSYTIQLKAVNPAGFSSVSRSIYLTPNLTMLASQIGSSFSGFDKIEILNPISINASFKLQAQKEIHLNPGFETQGQGVFKANIAAGCISD